jgi:ABC-type nitrate/sulfonate/bicarbonate transport system permease component
LDGSERDGTHNAFADCEFFPEPFAFALDSSCNPAVWRRRDYSPIFLIFLSVFFSVTLAIMAAVANIPAVYSRVANDYGLTGSEKLMRVTLPAIMPQVITSLRVAAGVAWLVVVAAEMIAGRTAWVLR